MSNAHPSSHLSAEQLGLWQRVNELWELSASKDAARIRESLHPAYVGWDMSTPLPHDRDAAVHSVTSDSPQLTSFDLEPLSIRVYDGSVGVVHYRYQAMVGPQSGRPVQVAGGWTEVYMKQHDRWLMIAVSGRPNAQGGTHGSASAAA